MSLFGIGVLGMIAASVIASPASSDQFVGTYSQKKSNCYIAGDGQECDGEVESLVVIDGNANGDYHVVAHLQFFNGHTCSLDAKATLRKGMLRAVEPLPPDDDCTMEVVSNGLKVTFRNASESCSALCGTRGGFNGYDVSKVSSKAEFNRFDQIDRVR